MREHVPKDGASSLDSLNDHARFLTRAWGGGGCGCGTYGKGDSVGLVGLDARRVPVEVVLT